MTVNTRAIELSGIDAVHDDNIGRYPDGSCNGNVAEPEFMSYVLKAGGMRISGDAARNCRKSDPLYRQAGQTQRLHYDCG